MAPQEWLETAELIGEWLADLLVQRYPNASDEHTSALLLWGCTAFCGEMLKDRRPFPEIERAQDALAETFERCLQELERTAVRAKGTA